ncbi:hypothetical protein FGO68_gene3936 [Halteria grandinella]|uniref:Uncharacterized protein n=1 Tax=Halteria grandinella TaxID=5974 RepID=A0A8J8NH02_HALGN|nr:hypothetical protein FGO68_gene3936 [Halteria grandinella]
MKVKTLVNNIKNAFKGEIEKIKEECRIRRTQPREQMQDQILYSLDMIAANVDLINLLCDRLRRMIVNKSKRSLCVDLIQELNIQIAKIKNLGN